MVRRRWSLAARRIALQLPGISFEPGPRPDIERIIDERFSFNWIHVEESDNLVDECRDDSLFQERASRTVNKRPFEIRLRHR